MHNHYVKLTGGSEQLAYTLSMGYLGQDGILEGTEFDKYSFRMNASSSLLNDRLKISTNIAGYSGVRTDLVDGTGNTALPDRRHDPDGQRQDGGIRMDRLVLRRRRTRSRRIQPDRHREFRGNINIQLSLLKTSNWKGP